MGLRVKTYTITEEDLTRILDAIDFLKDFNRGGVEVPAECEEWAKKSLFDLLCIHFQENPV